MTNKEIAKTFAELADLMELHDANEFKVRTYRNAYVALRRFPEPIEELETEQIMDQRGLGKAVVYKVEELLDYGQIEDLEELRSKTPSGVRDMLQVKGLGPKKIKIIWHELGIENVTDLLYACNENRLIEAKGFGQKTQEDLIAKLEFFMNARDKYLYATAERIYESVVSILAAIGIEVHPKGELLRKCNVVDDIELWCTGNPESLKEMQDFDLQIEDGQHILFNDDIKLYLTFTDTNLPEAISENDVPESIKNLNIQLTGSWGKGIDSSIPPELWDLGADKLANLQINQLIRMEDVKGVIHNHSTWSDGSHSISEMAQGCASRGYEYFVISDHSKTAFYANGLDEDRVRAQWKEIDTLNEQQPDFKIFKSIESDILFDGSLDYDDDVLKGFDLVIASIHSQLKMDIEKATSRLIKAIEHPATRILGHPTSRLLLGREGYPIDHSKIIDACAQNGVVLELNANPYRLDVDWRWIYEAQEKGVMISIDPDAHHIDGIDDIKYGVISARKGGLYREDCLSCKSLQEFEAWLAEK